MLIETLPAAFEMDEILYELRDHSAGLNAGRWDYIFSMIKCFRDRPEFVLPDRNEVTMTVPFMRAYTELLVKTCHRARRARDGRHGGVHPVAQGRGGQRARDRGRRARTRSARPTTASTAPGSRTPTSSTSRCEEFDAVLGDRPNQVDGSATTSTCRPTELLDAASTPGEITEEGLRNDVNVGIQYISSWLRGRGAAGINNLMEDAATAEISRSQVWQWVRHGKLDARRTCSPRSSTRRRRRSAPRSATRRGRRAGPTRRAEIFERVSLSDDFPEFLTLPAYEYLD